MVFELCEMGLRPHTTFVLDLVFELCETWF